MGILDNLPTEEILFIHNPRTSGKSICQALGIEQTHEPWWRRSFDHTEYRFTVFRNPWEQALSWYVSARIEETRGLSLEEWCVTGFWVGDETPYLERPDIALPWWIECHPFDQLDRAGDHLDAYFRFEDRQAWWPKLSSKPLPHINKSPRNREAWPKYTKAAADIVAERQAGLIERFGYRYTETI